MCIFIFLKTDNGYKFKFIISREKTSVWSFWGLLFPFLPLKLLIPSWVATKANNVDEDPQLFPLLCIPHLHRHRQRSATRLHFPLDLVDSCQQSMTQQQPRVCLPPKPGEEGATSTPKTHRPAANPSLKNTLSLVVNGFLSKDCCFPSLYF